MMDSNDLNWFGFVFLVFSFVAVFVVGLAGGEYNKQDDLLTQYCLYVEYERYIEVDGSYYCNKGDDLLLIDWMVK